MNRSKYEILTERAEHLECEAQKIRDELRWMDKTRLDVRCSGCGAFLYTEGDFARHFLVINPTYLNLGYCPVKTGERTIEGAPR